MLWKLFQLLQWGCPNSYCIAPLESSLLLTFTRGSIGQDLGDVMFAKNSSGFSANLPRLIQGLNLHYSKELV
jgi:hypothetical protein